jgi:O-antigen/teichoic acid export membrane protein
VASNLKENKMMKATVMLLLMRLYQIAIATILSIFLARLLGPNDYGGYIFVLTVVGMVVVPVQFGLSQLILRETAQAEFQKRHLSNFYRWCAAVIILFSFFGVIALITALSFFDHQSNKISSVLLIIASLLVCANNITFFLSAILAGRQFTGKDQFIQSMIKPTAFLSMLGLLVMGMGKNHLTSNSALATQLLSIILTIVISTHILRKAFPSRSAAVGLSHYEGKWLKPMLYFMTIGGIDVIMQSSDILMLGALGSSGGVAVYKVGGVLAGLLSLPLSVAHTYFSPRIQRPESLADARHLQCNSIRIGRISFVATLIMLAIALIFGSLAIELAYGNGYSGAYFIMVILSVGVLVNVVTGLNRAILMMLGRESIVFQVMGWSALMNIILNCALIPLLGPLGAAIATCAAMIFSNIWLHIASYKVLGFSVAIFSSIRQSEDD